MTVKRVTPEELGAELDGFTQRRLPGQVSKAADRVTLRIAGKCLMLSPVDTGAYRNSWNVSRGEPDETVRSGGGMAAGVSLPPEKGDSWDKAATMRYVNNSIAYARRLEDGWSKQAPSGVGRLAIQGSGEEGILIAMVEGGE